MARLNKMVNTANVKAVDSVVFMMCSYPSDRGVCRNDSESLLFSFLVSKSFGLKSLKTEVTCIPSLKLKRFPFLYNSVYLACP